MMRQKSLKHRFVGHIPEDVEAGVLYISLDYATAVHSCCCGCGEEVVTPISPTDWKMTFNGETVSLQPSIGSWSLPCRSHYVIKCGRIIEADQWTDEQISVERRRDQKTKARHYGTSILDIENKVVVPKEGTILKPVGLWGRFWRKVTSD